MKIHWFSNGPWVGTGYGVQTKLFLPRIRSLGHELSATAFYGLQGGILSMNGFTVYPNGFTDYGGDILAANAKHAKADIVITLIDAWVYKPEMFQGVRWVPLFPVDMEPIPPPVLNAVKHAYQGIVYSQFGKRMAENAGLDVRYVPHAIDTTVFAPRDKREAREKVKLPQDAFIVGMVAANKGTPSRKAFQQNIEAFAHFRTHHSDAILVLHTTSGQNGEMAGINLPELCETLGLRVGTDVLFADQYMLRINGYNDEYMATLYSAMDVHLLASMGEGFGVPILEAQACGTPVIVGDWTSMPELCFAGWKVPRPTTYVSGYGDIQERYWTPLAAYQVIPRIGDILEALEHAYDKRGDEELCQRARNGALAYDADTVTETYWKPVLAEIERRITREQRLSETSQPQPISDETAMALLGVER